MLELMHIHQPESVAEQGVEVGRRVLKTISGLIAACRGKLTGAASSKDLE